MKMCFEKINFCLVAFFAVLISSCGSNSQNEIVKDQSTISAECICKAWGGEADTSGKATAEGFKLLDHYLLEYGYLGKGTLEDYYHFALDTSRIVIPLNADSVNKIKLAIYSGYSTFPDYAKLGKCFDDLYNNSKNNDSTGLKHLGHVMYELRNAGVIDIPAFYSHFFKGLDENDFSKPLFKYCYYFLLLKRIEIK